MKVTLKRLIGVLNTLEEDSVVDINCKSEAKFNKVFLNETESVNIQLTSAAFSGTVIIQDAQVKKEILKEET